MVLDLWEKTNLIPPLGFVSLRHTCHHIKMSCVLKIKNKKTKPTKIRNQKIHGHPILANGNGRPHPFSSLGMAEPPQSWFEASLASATSH